MRREQQPTLLSIMRGDGIPIVPGSTLCLASCCYLLETVIGKHLLREDQIGILRSGCFGYILYKSFNGRINHDLNVLKCFMEPVSFLPPANISLVTRDE